MKKSLLLFLLIASLKSFAFDFKINDLYFDIVSRENHLVSFSGIATDVEELTIPSTIKIENEEWFVSSH